jgi:hypothetical protein
MVNKNESISAVIAHKASDLIAEIAKRYDLQVTVYFVGKTI